MFNNNNCNLKSEESYFVNIEFCDKIGTVFPCTKFTINLKEKEVLQKSYFIIAEKIETHSLLQVRVSETGDHSKMFLSTVDGNSFERLKRDQSLHVTFSGFIENLVRILNNCRNREMQINLVQTEEDHLLQFYEVRSFRNLVHLILPVKRAQLSTVLYHVNRSLQMLQKQHANYENTIQLMREDISRKDKEIQHLKVEIEKLSSNLAEEQNLMVCRTNEEVNRLQSNLIKVTESKEFEEAQLKMKIAELEGCIEQLNRKKLTLQDEKISEIRKNEALRAEYCVYKSNAAVLKVQNEKFHIQICSLRNVERKNEMHLDDLRKQVKHLQESLKKESKLKSDLAAELEAEKKVSHGKRNALHLATEEIAKANVTIAKQSKEIINLHKNIEWRTDVALKQELVIQERDKQIEMQIIQLQHNETELKKYEEYLAQYQKELELIRQAADKIESQYSEKISKLSTQIGLLEKIK